MTTFLLFTFLLVCLGIFVRIFWIPLMFIGSILCIILGIIVSAGITAFTLEIIHAMTTDGIWTGFSTYFTYSAVFYSVLMFVYVSIVGDIFGKVLNFFKK
jgi:hypothetical protein